MLSLLCALIVFNLLALLRSRWGDYSSDGIIHWTPEAHELRARLQKAREPHAGGRVPDRVLGRGGFPPLSRCQQEHTRGSAGTWGIPVPTKAPSISRALSPWEVLACVSSEAVPWMACLWGGWGAEPRKLDRLPALGHGGHWRNRSAEHLAAHSEFRLQCGCLAIALHRCLSHPGFQA